MCTTIARFLRVNGYGIFFIFVLGLFVFPRAVHSSNGSEITALAGSLTLIYTFKRTCTIYLIYLVCRACTRYVHVYSTDRDHGRGTRTYIEIPSSIILRNNGLRVNERASVVHAAAVEEQINHRHTGAHTMCSGAPCVYVVK